MTTEGIILICIGIAIAILCIVIIVKQAAAEKRNGREDIAILVHDTEILKSDIAGEFARSRADAARSSAEARADSAAAFESITARLDKMNKNNLEHEIQMNKLISNSLADIREKNAEQNEKQTRTIDTALRNLREENEKKLEQMRATVSEKLDETLAKRLDSSFETVSKQLENLYKSLGEMKELSVGVTDNVSALNRVLTNVKSRGTWAEIQLKGILDQIIPGRYVENYRPQGATGQVEYAVIIPSVSGKQTYLPLDSKFPMEDYIRLTEAADRADSAALSEARKALERRIKDEAQEISKKYIFVPETTPFAILYLATEGLYAEAVSISSLSEYIHEKYHVMLAGPSTITALLNSLAMGFASVAVNEKAEEVRTLLAAVKSQYDKFGGLLEKARKKVDEAGKTLDEAQHRNVLIQKKLKGVESLDGGNADELLFDGDYSVSSVLSE